MNRAAKNRILDDAVREIQGHPGSVATLVSVLSYVFSEGYSYGLSQGHADRKKPEKPLGPMAVHSFEQDEDKTGSACRFCGLDERNPVHKAGAGPL